MTKLLDVDPIESAYAYTPNYASYILGRMPNNIRALANFTGIISKEGMPINHGSSPKIATSDSVAGIVSTKYLLSNITDHLFIVEFWAQSK